MKVKVVECLVKSCHESVFDFYSKHNENIEFFSKLLPMGNGTFFVTKLPFHTFINRTFVPLILVISAFEDRYSKHYGRPSFSFIVYKN